MKHRRLEDSGCRRGSVLVYILVLTVAMCSIVLSIVSFSSFRYRAVLHDEQAMRAQYAFEGAINSTRYNLANGIVTVPSTTSYTIGSWTIPLTLADNGGSLANTLAASYSATRWNRTFAETIVIGNSSVVQDPTWWNFAVSMDTTSDFGGYLTTHGIHDDVYCNHTFTVDSWSTMADDLWSVHWSKPANLTVTDTFFGNQTPKVFPTVNNSTYASAASQTLSGNQTFYGYTTFTSNKLLYINGNLHISGTLRGTCTMYVTGDIYMDGGTNYYNSTSRFVFITPNDILFQTDDQSYVGLFFGGTSIQFVGDVSIDYGGLVAKQFFAGYHDNLDVTWDDEFKTNPGAAVSLHVPGFWP